MQAGAVTNQDGLEAARSAGLRYVTDRKPGIQRIRAGGGFRYVGTKTKSLDSETVERIKRLAIPPAWTRVWICPDPQGHIQATGRDARGRKQYRYHSHWREQRDENKYSRMIGFGTVLPKLRRRIRQDLRQQGLGRNKVLAAIAHLLELSGMRIGNEEYAVQNHSYGLTTLQNRHARIRGSKIEFRFRGKAGIEQRVAVQHPLLSRIVKRCQDLPGQDLFQYVDDEGTMRDVTSGDVNDYLVQVTGQEFTAKDFRTWRGTLLAAVALCRFELKEPGRRSKRNIVRAIEEVATHLGNTPTICRKCYIHPVILESYLDGSLGSAMGNLPGTAMDRRPRCIEAALLRLLRNTARKSRG
ncbi:MAG: topoisomerase [Verrucomicrobiota bacterium]|jgi:DNA topoisomerase-1